MFEFLKKKKCNHSIKDENTTLEKTTKRVMINPDETRYVCRVCHKTFIK